MHPSSIPSDTTPEAFELLVETWRSMSIADRVAQVEQLNADVEMLAIAGITARHPGLTEVELRHELARRRYGQTLADAAYEHLLT